MVATRHNYKTGRLTSRPGTPAASGPKPAGVQPLSVQEQQAGLLYVPKGYDSSRPAALAVMLHGAGGRAEQGLSLLQSQADKLNLILLAPPPGPTPGISLPPGISGQTRLS
ncbi:hypothetical protein [Pontibacter litorisediminis]|uniref:hypothetical protein n=1 Tax=Pontibacter litorisediminis TaxID=1846260 RepID=UPI0023EC5BEF|nr:hypothetical protein [Pontibacter litorisediminis]